MSRCFNFLLRCVQFYSIFYGLTYIYIDFKNSLVKFNIYIKIYVYSINFIYSGIMIYFLITTINSLYNDERIMVLKYVHLFLYVIRIFIIYSLVSLRIKEEKSIKKWLHNLSEISSYETTKIITILIILIMFAHNFYNLHKSVNYAINGEWLRALNACAECFSFNIHHYVMLHHGFLINYINGCFSKLNTELKTVKVQEPFADIYIKFSQILEEVNTINSSIICSVFLSKLMEISFNLFLIFALMCNLTSYKLPLLLETCIFNIFFVDIFLYFLICENLDRTCKETGKILKEYSVMSKNWEVCIVKFIFCFSLNNKFLLFTG